jgi:hypothetical protein
MSDDDEIEIMGEDYEDDSDKSLEDAIAEEAEDMEGIEGTEEKPGIEIEDSPAVEEPLLPPEPEPIAPATESPEPTAPAIDAPESVSSEPPEASGHVMAKLHEKMKVRAPEEIKKPMKAISFRDLEDIIHDLIQKYGGMERADLLQRIAVLELKLAQGMEKAQKMVDAERAKIDQRVAEKVVEWEKKCAIAEGMVQDLEEKLLAAEKRIEQLERELAAARAALTTEEQKSREELERRISELEARMVELEMGLDYYDLEKEIDAPAVREQVSGAKRHVDGRSETVAQMNLQKKIEQLSERLQTAHETYDALKEKMYSGKGSIGVVVDMIKAVKESESVEEQARDISQSMEA